MVSTHVIKVTPAVAVMTPMALATFSHDIFGMCKDYQSEIKSILSKTYLYCVSIELGLKAAILAVDCNSHRKKLIKSLGHDLLKTYDCFNNQYKIDLFNDSDLDIIRMVNPYFCKKGLEYFTPEVLMAMMKGYRDIPRPEIMLPIAEKVEKYLQDSAFFIEANSSVKPSRGIIAFV